MNPNYWISNNNILFQREDGVLLIAGCNGNNNKTNTVPSNGYIGKPRELGLQLRSGETVAKFHAYYTRIFILTNQGRLLSLGEGRGDRFNDILNSCTYDKTRTQFGCQKQLNALNNFNFQSNTLPETVLPISQEFQTKLLANPDVIHERDFESYDERPTASLTSIKNTRWELLDMESFDKLRGQQRASYISNTQSEIERAFRSDDSNSWVKDSDKLDRAFKQLDTPEPLNNDNVKPSTSCQPIQPIHQHSSSSVNMNDHSISKTKNCVEDVVFGQHRIMYKIGEHFVVEIINNNYWPSVLEHFSTLHMQKINLDVNCYRICPACLPKHDRCLFLKHFVYLGKDNNHWLIFPIGATSPIVEYTHFTTDFDFDPHLLKWDHEQSLVYIILGNDLWYKSRVSNTLIKCRISVKKLLFMKSDYYDSLYNQTTSDCVLSVNSGISEDRTECIPIISNLIISNLRQIFRLCCLSNQYEFIFAYEEPLKNNEDRVSLRGDKIFVNVFGLKAYGQPNVSNIVFIDQFVMYAITSNTGQYSVNYLKFEKRISIHRIPLPVSAENISCVKFDGLIVLEVDAEQRYIYYSSSTDKHNFRQMMMPRIKDFTSQSLTIENLLFQPPLNLDDCGTVPIDKNDNNRTHYSKIINYIAKTSTPGYISIKTYKGEIREAFGRGVRVSSFTKTMHEFANQYLIRHNSITEFNSALIKNLDPGTLRFLGKILAFCFLNLDERLLYHMPLTLLSALLCKIPTQAEFEYIAEKEDPVAYQNLIAIKADPAIAPDIDYDEAIRSVCKFYPYTQIIEIARGFLENFYCPSLHLMNVVTLDEFLSGKYVLDVERLISQINIDTKILQEHVRSNIFTLFVNLIRSLNQKQLATLLYNLSGTSVINSSWIYGIKIVQETNKTAVKFGTCDHSVYVPKVLIEHFLNGDIDIDDIKQVLVPMCDILVD